MQTGREKNSTKLLKSNLIICSLTIEGFKNSTLTIEQTDIYRLEVVKTACYRSIFNRVITLTGQAPFTTLTV